MQPVELLTSEILEVVSFSTFVRAHRFEHALLHYLPTVSQTVGAQRTLS